MCLGCGKHDGMPFPLTANSCSYLLPCIWSSSYLIAAAAALAAVEADVATSCPPDLIDASTLPLLLFGPFNATRLSLKLDVLFDDAVAPATAVVEFEMVSVLLAQLRSDECWPSQSNVNENENTANKHAHTKLINNFSSQINTKRRDAKLITK